MSYGRVLAKDLKSAGKSTKEMGNVKGPHFTIQKELPLIPDGGVIVLNASGKRRSYRYSALWKVGPRAGRVGRSCEELGANYRVEAVRDV